MTLDEYEAMMAEKQPKINKEAAKPKVRFVTCLRSAIASVFLAQQTVLELLRQGCWVRSCMALGQLQYLCSVHQVVACCSNSYVVCWSLTQIRAAQNNSLSVPTK